MDRKPKPCNRGGLSVCTGRLSAVFLAIGFAVSPVQGETPRYFEGKTITYVVGQAAGGGYDRFARMLAPFLGERLGARRVVVKNEPTAGGVPALRDVIEQTPDGLHLSTMNTGLLMSQIGGLDSIDFDLADMAWIGKATSESRVVIVRPEAGVARFEDLVSEGEPLLFATSRYGGASFVQTHLLRRVFGLNIAIVPGLSGSEAEAALMKGEVQGLLVSESNVPPLIASGDAVAVLVFGTPFDESLQKVRRWTDLELTEEQELVARQIDTMSRLGRLVATTPDTPEPILAELRQAFLDVMTDPAFITAARENSLHLDPLGGEGVQALVEEFLSTDPQFAELIAAVLAE